MFKIGLFTFGGGYAMIAVIQRELVEKKKWIEQEEYLDVVAIAESTPGPIAINSSTFVGYRVGGVLGSIFATLGMILPSFTIIFIISLFFDQFLELKFVGYAFRGIQACIGFLIFSAGIKMFKSIKKRPFNLVMFIVTMIALTALDLFALNFSTIYFVLLGGIIGIVSYLISLIKTKDKEKGDK